MFYLGLLCAILGLIGYIWCLVEAFGEDTTQGVLSMCVPFYAFYFILAKIDSPKKWIILVLVLLGIVGRLVMYAG